MNTTVKAVITIYYPTSVAPSFVNGFYSNLTQAFKKSVSTGVFATVIRTFATNNNCSALITYNPKSLPLPSATQLTPVGGSSSAPVVSPTATTASAGSNSDTTMVPGITDFALEIGIAVFGAIILGILACFCLWRRNTFLNHRKQLDKWIMGEVPGLNVISRYSSERAIK